MRTSITLKSGTVLPLMNLKGKEYLQVAHRLVWFREEHPGWSIETEFLSQDDKGAVCKATIRNDEHYPGRVIATAHKEESSKDFAQGHREKAETGAIGRALALCGFGTQFEPELDEGDRVVDSPMLNIHAAKNMQPGPEVGIQPEGYRLPGLSKDCTDRLMRKFNSNPTGKPISVVDSKILEDIVLFMDEKYADKEMPEKTAMHHEEIINELLKRGGVHKFNAYENEHKNAEKQPDYKIFLKEEKQAPQPKITPKIVPKAMTEEDVPF